MSDILRSLRLGVVNLIGITMPGLLLILFVIVGFILPILNFLLQINNSQYNIYPSFTMDTIYNFYFENKFIFGIILFLLAYLLGYVIRLWAVDILDKRSAEEIFRTMATEQKDSSNKKGYFSFRNKKRNENINKGVRLAVDDCWPYQRGKNEIFPYFHTKEYLERRGLNKIAQFVIWGPKPVNDEEHLLWCQRSKAIINIIKIAIEKESPDLSAIVESNEAHIRLLFGTWEVSRISIPLLLIGLIVSLFSSFNYIFNWYELAQPYIPHNLLIFSIAIILALSVWLEHRIRKLFHYQRVRELTQILGCAYFVNKENNTITDVLNKQRV